MNNKGTPVGDPSRSGDIVLMFDTSRGVISVTESDILFGWHAGPTPAESWVPMMWSYPGAVGPDAAHRSDLIEGVIKAKIEAIKQANNDLRTVDFKGIVVDSVKAVKGNRF